MELYFMGKNNKDLKNYIEKNSINDYNNGPASLGNKMDININNANLTPFSAGTGVDLANLDIGTGTNSISGSVGVPLSLGLALDMHTEANSYWNVLGKSEKTRIINYVQSATTGREAKQRVSKSILGLSQQDLNFLNQ
jgi:hypothetical protein